MRWAYVTVVSGFEQRLVRRVVVIAVGLVVVGATAMAVPTVTIVVPVIVDPG